MKILQRMSAIMIAVLWVVGAFAQEIPERSIHYRPGDFLGIATFFDVTSITIGHDQVYFGTSDGISRYNFYFNRWEDPFTVCDGLADDRILAVLYDMNTGNLWCAAESGVSYRISSAEEWHNFPYETVGAGPIRILGRGDAFLWMDAGSQIIKADPMAGFFWNSTAEESEADNVRWNPNRENGETDSLPDLFAENGLFFDPNGFVKDIHLRQYPVTDTYVDAFSHMWIGTGGNGAAVADLRTFWIQFLPFGLYIPDVQCMAWDEDKLWIGGLHLEDEDGAITCWDQENGEWEYYEARIIPELRSDQVTAILPDSDAVWFGTGEGLVRYDKENDRWKMITLFEGLSDNRITCLARTDSILWVGTESGLSRVVLPGLAAAQVRDKRLGFWTVYKLAADGPDLWVCTDRGTFLYRSEGGTWEWVRGYAGIFDTRTTAVSVWNDEVWLGTDDGIEMLDRASNTWQGFPQEHFPIGGNFLCLYVDGESVWAGTDSGVLRLFKSENRWRRYTTDDGLLDNRVQWIVPDKDWIWFGTPRGLTRFYWNAPYRKD